MKTWTIEYQQPTFTELATELGLRVGQLFQLVELPPNTNPNLPTTKEWELNIRHRPRVRLAAMS